MNKLNSILLTVLTTIFISIFFISCEKDFVKEQATLENSDSNKEVLNFLIDNLKLDPEKITESGEVYIYDRCTVFSKEGIKEQMQSNRSAKHYKWGKLKAGLYYLQYENNVPQVWKDQMKNAYTEWNKLNGHIQFSEVNYGSVATFKVRYSNFKTDGISGNDDLSAVAYPPPNPHQSFVGVMINSDPEYDNLSNSKKMNLMVHELGHMVGFFHTNQGLGDFIYTDNSTCNWHNNYDTQSVMYRYAGGNNWNGFTTCDIAAYEALYERVFIKSNNNKYMCSENGNTWAIANRTALGAWEKFKLKKNNDGSYSILASNNRYADINRGAGHYVKFNNTDRYCGDCKFWLNNLWGDIYSIQSVATGKFLSSKGGNSSIRCDKTSVGADERWQIYNLSN